MMELIQRISQFTAFDCILYNRHLLTLNTLNFEVYKCNLCKPMSKYRVLPLMTFVNNQNSMSAN